MKKKNQLPRLTEKEAEIMQMFWERGELTVRQLLEGYDDPKPHVNTVATIVHILEEKGFVTHSDEPARRGAFVFRATVGPEAFRAPSLALLVRNYFKNSYASVVSALVEDEKISLDELKEIIDMVENKKEK